MSTSPPGSGNKHHLAVIVRLVLDDAAGAFPYFLVFYALSLVLARLVPSWRTAFYWPVFHGSVVALGLMAVLSDRVRSLGLGRYVRNMAFSLTARVKAHHWRRSDLIKLGLAAALVGLAVYLNVASRNLLLLIIALVLILFGAMDAKLTAGLGRYARNKALLLVAWVKTRHWSRTKLAKLAVAAAVLGSALYLNTGPWNLLLIFFALASVLFGVVDSRLSIGLGLALLAACAVSLLLLDKASVAEVFAIHAYYFLGIAFLTLAADPFRSARPDKAAAKQGRP